MSSPSTEKTSRRRAVALLATALAATLTTGSLAGGPAGPAAAVPGTPAGVFDPASTSWNSFRDQLPAVHDALVTSMKSAGQIPVDVDGQAFVMGSVWQANIGNRDWRLRRGLDNSAYSSYWQQMKTAGFRPVEQESYVSGGERQWAGIWIKNTEGLSWASHRSQTSSQFAASYDAHKAAGLMPVDYDEYSTSNGLRIDSVWVKAPSGADWRMLRGLTSTSYGNGFDQLKGTHRPISMDSVTHAGGQRYSSIWVRNTSRRWAAWRDLSAQGFKNQFHRYKDLGYRVVAFNRYSNPSGQTRYGVIFRQNSTRPDWALRAQVDAIVQKELDTYDVPGISVAVFTGGVARYQRGFGYANTSTGEWMDSEHVGSIASVSKAVAGVLTFRMREQGDVFLSHKTRALVPAMPAHHTHSVGNLLSNRGCVHHYDGSEHWYDDEPYATARAASEEFWDDDLIDGCDLGEYNYTTHGYTLLGAALESAGGDDIKDLVRKRLTTPFQLGTLGPQNFSPSVHRMTQYDDGDEVDTFNNDWKVLGGGIDSSAVDLASFGSKLVRGQILTANSRTTMWTRPNSAANYGYGWDLGSESGTQVVAKGGSFTGTLAYLRLYPAKGIAVAVMMNDRDGDTPGSASRVGKAVGAKVLASMS